MTDVRVLVTGSRTWEDETAVRSALVQAWIQASPHRVVVVHGACPTGADAIADSWASAMAEAAPETCAVERYPADWRRYGKSAGPVRNAKMVALVEVLPDGWRTSRSTS